jgi:hypothetical protein
MKRIVLVLMVALAMAGFAVAQVTSPTADVLGAHNVYGRGCIACHAPHSGAAANGGSAKTNQVPYALWGEDLTPLYGANLTFAGETAVSLPDLSTYTGDRKDVVNSGFFGIEACLSCHDGNLAKSGMMKGTSFETVSIAGATFNPPTLLGNDGSGVGNYLNDHPVGPDAKFSCGGQYNWDCTVASDGTISFSGAYSSQFLSDYYDVVKYGPIKKLVKMPGTQVTNTDGTISYTSNNWVTCTTCHDQHNMQYFSAGPKGNKPTHFFVRGWYDPGNTTTSNSAAQFCRTCHGGEANEVHGQNVPTT